MDGARQAVEAVRGRLQRDADLPRVDGDADAARGRLGRAHDPAGVERDLDAAVAAARQQVAAGEGGHEGVGRVRHQLAAVPSWRRRPSTMTPIRSASAAASRKSWVTSSVGSARAPSTSCSSPRTTARVCASSAESGSSRSRTCGSRARARATRDALALAARQPARALVGQVRDPHAVQQLAHAGRRSRRRRRRWPRTVMCGKSAYSWKTSPTERRSGGRSTLAAASNQALPPRAMRPRSGRRRPAMARRTVVLPAPEGPTSATVSAAMLRLTPSSNERRPTAMSSSRFSTRRGSCTRAAPRR